MSTPLPDPHKQELQRRLEYFKLRRRFQSHSLPWIVCRWAWAGIRLAFAALRASATLRRQERFSEDRKRARNAERIDRIRNPHHYRGRE